MCTILLAWRCVSGADLVVAATRDEFFGRPASHPRVLRECPTVVGGRDLRTGGTWMAVTPSGRLATVTNRWCESIDPSRRSRGELPLALLDQPDDASVLAFLRRLRADDYNPFNVLYASPSRAFVGHADGTATLRVVELDPGHHVLTLRDLNQVGDAKTQFLQTALHNALGRAPDAPAVLGELEAVLGEHGDGSRADLDATCVHGEGYGTVSATSMAIGAGGAVYRYAPGPPCTTAWRDSSSLLQPEFGTASTL